MSPSRSPFHAKLLIALAFLLLVGNRTQAQTSPVSLSPASLSFGSQNVGSSGTQTIKVTNNQRTALTLSGIAASGDFTVAGTSTCSTSTSLAFNKSCSVDV